MILWILLLTITELAGVIIIRYNDPSKCEGNTYFESSSLRCVQCGVNQVKGSNLACRCENGFRTLVYNGGPELSCAACAALHVSTLNRWGCIKCRTDGDYNPVTRACTPCAQGEVYVERNEDGSLFADNRQRCLSCRQDTKSGKSQPICQRCDNRVLEVTSGASCNCPVGTQTVGGIIVTTVEEDGICFSSNRIPFIADQASAYIVVYPNGESFESAFFKQHLRSSQALCKAYQNYTSCQLLANLCVMYMYNQNNFLNSRIVATDACKEFLLIVSSFKGDFVQRLTDWPVSIPWLYYKADNPVDILDRTDISTSFSRKELLRFMFVRYSPEGRYLGITNSSVLQICESDERIKNNAFQFTTTYKISCNIKVSELVSKQTEFYDIYFYINDADLYPVPVLVENINANQGSSRSSWVLTRRFFLVDNISGRSADGSLAIIQYASSVTVLYRLRDDGKIYPPLLKIKYGSVSISGTSNNSVVSMSFETQYEMNVDSIVRGIEISIGVFAVLGIIYAGIRIISWRRRENIQMIDCTSIMIFFIFLCSALSFVFIIVILGAGIQWLFFFKQQTTVIRVLPTDTQERLSKILLIIAFFMKLIDVCYIIYSQISFDVFFVDWERPRGNISLSNNDGQNKSVNSPVSIMRTLFVANEFREIQTMRRIKPMLQIILLLLFMKVIGFEYWTTTDPISRKSVDYSIDYVGKVNFTLRFSVVCLIFILSAVVQWLLFGFLYERFISDSLGDFIDFCSISNISIFIISRSYYGFYIHGRSVHGRSDTSLHELYEQFQREEDNLCGKRGLEPNTDNQTFEISLTMKFKNEYSKIKQPLLTRDVQSARLAQPQSRQNPGLPGTLLNTALEKSVTAYGQMNRFLSSFIEHAIVNNDYIVKNKYFMEKLLKNEVEAPIDKCHFYNDESRSFTEILLYGQEWSIIIFYMISLFLVDWISGWNFYLALIVTYFLDIIVVTVRDSFGRKNLAKKTMVDERFLI